MPLFPPVWTLVTGQPSCGKTYLIERLADELASAGARCRGFVTEAVEDKHGRRVGFDIVTIPDRKRAVLARKKDASQSKSSVKKMPSVGEYRVDVESFEQLALPAIAPDPGGVDLFVLDEIGRMELQSERFRTAVSELLAGKVALLGSVAAPRYGHTVPFCEDIKALPSVDVVHLKASTRASVAAEVRAKLPLERRGVRRRPAAAQAVSAKRRRTASRGGRQGRGKESQG
mmetsp:Transcript_25931/g.74916  ORF Transcript_25931/g.74916 Transcript_25931/m.74916 type:complete len:230 (+) Transcript_25931:25-714(+)